MLYRSLCSFLFLPLFGLCIASCSSAGSQGQGSTGDARVDSSAQDEIDTRVDTAGNSQGSTSGAPVPGWGKPVAMGEAIDEFGQEMSPPVVAMNQHGQAVAAWSSWNEEVDPPSPHLYVSLFKDNAWQPALEVVDHHARDAKVAINARGDLVVSYARLFHQASGHGWSEEPWARRYVDGVWLVPERVGFQGPQDGSNATYVGALQVKISATGELLMVWRQSDTRTPKLHEGLFASYFGAGTWSAPIQLDTRMPSFVDTFSMDLNDAGQGRVIWLDQVTGSGVDPKDKVQRYVTWGRAIAQGNWGQATPLDRAALTGAVVHTSPRVVVDASGNAYAVYMEGELGKVIMSKLWYAHSAAAGQGWDTRELLHEGASTALSFETGIAVSESGVVATGWRADSKLHPDHSSAFLRVLDPKRKAWGEALELSTHASGVQTAPLLNVDAKGQIWTAWRQSDADPKASIHARSFALEQGLGDVQKPAHGESLALAGNAKGQMCLVTRHHYVSQSPLGYFSAPTGTMYWP